MREIGTVKWFGGHNNETGRDVAYGFISHPPALDIFVHKNDLIDPMLELREGDLVVFEIAVNSRNGKPKAIGVKHWTRELHDTWNAMESSDGQELETYSSHFLWVASQVNSGRLMGWLRQPAQRHIRNYDSMRELFDPRELRLLDVLDKYAQGDTNWLDDLAKLATTDQQILERLPSSFAETQAVFSLLPANHATMIVRNRLATLFQFPWMYSIAARIVDRSTLKNVDMQALEDPDFLSELKEDLQFEALLLRTSHSKDETATRELIKLVLSAPHQFVDWMSNWPGTAVRILHVLLYDFVINDELRQEGIIKLLQDHRFLLDTWLNRLPSQIALHHHVLPLLGLDQELDVRLKLLVSSPSNENRARCIEIITTHVSDLKLNWEEIAPEELLHEISIIPFLNPSNQLRIAWLKLDDHVAFEGLWDAILPSNQILMLYRSVFENIRLPITPRMTSDLRARAIHNLVHSAREADESHQQLYDFDEAIHSYISQLFYQIDQPIDLLPILARCPVGMTIYCEGRPWPTDDDTQSGKLRASRIYCPRLRKECRHIGSAPVQALWSYSGAEGSHVYPVDDISWESWSIVELLEALRLAVPPEISRPQEYMTQLGGEINRVIEVRKHLKCSVCGEVMRSDKEYAKNLAVYRATVFSCGHGGHHDTRVYINHCWGCENHTIDSRTERISIGGYRLCLVCGSGRNLQRFVRDRKSHDWNSEDESARYYRQGDVCPKCGALSNIDHLQIDKGVIECEQCGHRIELPPKHKITGVEDWSLRHRYLLSRGFKPAKTRV